MKRIIQVFILVVGMLLVLTAWYVIKVGYLVSDERETVQSVKSQTETTMSKVRRGEYLTQVANCSGCHTNTGGALYAGGKVVQSEFGNFVVPNITPDSRTGIGRWSVNDFGRHYISESYLMVGCYILHFRTRTMHSYREKMQRQCLLISKVYLRLTNHLLPINYVFRITNGHYWRFGAPFIFVRKPISRILVGPLTGIVVRILSMDWGIAAPATAVEIC